ncbi:MAG: FmdB family zinc ribbon protein [Candidatus Hydrogenedentota bacterium]
MPTYSYQCTKCQSVQEVYHSMSAEPEIRCKDCGAETRRLMGAGAGILFRGTGFYETDYKRGNGQGKSPEAQRSDAKSDKSESAGGSSKENSASSGGDSSNKAASGGSDSTQAA